MQKNTLKLVLLLVLCLALVFVLAGCPKTPDPGPEPGPGPKPGPGPEPGPGPQPTDKSYTYTDSVSTMASNWNNHIYESNDDSYPISFISTGFYDVVFADDTYTNYEIVPAMAASYPVDVTSEYVGEKWGITENDQYRAWKIELNPNACWENGVKIDAETYLYSIKALFDPQRINYRAADWMGDTSDFSIKGGYEYFWSDRTEQQCVYYATNKKEMTPENTDMYLDVAYAGFFLGDSMKNFYEDGYADYFTITYNGETYDFYAKYAEQGEVKVTAEIIGELLALSANFGDSSETAWQEWVYWYYAHPHATFEDVGVIKNGDYSITFILSKSLGGKTGDTYAECEDAFYLLYNLSGNFLVYPEYYEKYGKFEGDNKVYSSTYNTSVETTMSYGPYKLTKYTRDAYMEYERNDKWYGYSVDAYKGMYQTSKITTRVVKESETRKLMFLKGQLMAYGLQTDDFDEYRYSRYAYFTPSDSIFFMVLSGHKDILKREDDTTNKSMILNTNFRKGMALIYDKDQFCAATNPAQTAAFGIFGNTYVVDPATGETYRSTDAAKKVLCEYYGVKYGEGELYETLDEAVASITGYDAKLAKEYLLKAYEEEVAAGNLKEGQTIVIDYSASTASARMQMIVNYMTEKVDEVVKGTALEGRIKFTISSAVGGQWAPYIKNGTRDVCLCGWTGARMNPFGLVDLYVNPARAYDAAWYDGSQQSLTIDLSDYEDGKYGEITLTLKQWSDALQGGNVKDKEGNVYNFGANRAEKDTRVYILSRCELAILGTGSYIPMMQDASLALRSAKAHFITDTYNPMLGYGGIAYLVYDYDDAAWDEFVKANNSDLKDVYKAA